MPLPQFLLGKRSQVWQCTPVHPILCANKVQCEGSGFMRNGKERREMNQVQGHTRIQFTQETKQEDSKFKAKRATYRDLVSKSKNKIKNGWKCSSVIEPQPGMHQPLSSIPSTEKQGKERRRCVQRKHIKQQKISLNQVSAKGLKINYIQIFTTQQ